MLVLGVMSGTSADGIDVALARISGAPPHIHARLLRHTSIEFPAPIRKEILHIAEQKETTAGDLTRLHFRLGEIYAHAALAACRRFKIPPRGISLIGNHGQTVFHQGRAVPYHGEKLASTLQIGESSIIAAKTGITTVGDFRPADMALGGQGAPLVPYVDYILYRSDKCGRISLNLGGIANVTVLPRACRPEHVVAFDTGPANILVDALVTHFTHGRQRFDRDAQLAAQGRSIPALLDKLMADPYLKLPPPKSTGREYYGHSYLTKLLILGRLHRAEPADLVRAVTLFTSLSIVDALHRFILPKVKIQQLIVSGGGARNPLIMAQLAAALPGVEVLPSSELGIPEHAKEAFAFALLAYESFHQRPSNLPSATGARGPAILGKISYAPPR
jgi:anhydro-N-acetylmuramic acid kinase